jgi:hypothetical protein
MHECQNKGVAEFAIHKWMKTKDLDGGLFWKKGEGVWKE